MKVCPNCKSTYTDDSLLFCLQDGARLAPRSYSDDLTVEIENAFTEVDPSAPTVQNLSASPVTDHRQKTTVVLSPPALSKARPSWAVAITGVVAVLVLCLAAVAIGVGVYFYDQAHVRDRPANTTSEKNDNSKINIRSVETPLPTPDGKTLTQQSAGSTVISSPSDAEMLVGVHRFSLQWVSWNYFGTATVSENGGTYALKGEQRSRQNSDFVRIDGVISSIRKKEFTFNGKVETQVSFINGGKPCVRDGELTFKVTENRKYWRMQQIDNPCDEAADYVDIYFR